MTAKGDTLYRYDENSRVYRRDANGRPYGGPIFSEYFRPHVISGETIYSWLAGGHKINKKTMIETTRHGGGDYKWYTEQGKNDKIWMAENRYTVVKFVEWSQDVALLKRIFALIGSQDEAASESKKRSGEQPVAGAGHEPVPVQSAAPKRRKTAR